MKRPHFSSEKRDLWDHGEGLRQTEQLLLAA
jgi:hypothetical protein